MRAQPLSARSALGNAGTATRPVYRGMNLRAARIFCPLPAPFPQRYSTSKTLRSRPSNAASCPRLPRLEDRLVDAGVVHPSTEHEAALGVIRALCVSRFAVARCFASCAPPRGTLCVVGHGSVVTVSSAACVWVVSAPSH
eukprot:6468028-Amphidinium_carterae.1